MYDTLTPAEMKRYESEAIQRLNISSDSLMQNAASALAETAESLCAKPSGHILAFCGCGNNGGDGLATLRILLSRHPGWKAEIFQLPGVLSPDCEREKRRLLQQFPSCENSFLQELPSPDGCELLVIDALFGTGLNRSLTGCAAEAVRTINAFAEAGVPVLAADIPSGIHGESGEMLGEAVRASVTVTFHRPKIGLYRRDGIDHAGRIKVCPIGLPKEAEGILSPSGTAVLEEADLQRMLPKRKASLHKGSCGKLLFFAGSMGMAGAAALCATAALRCGAGLVRIACPEAILPILQILCPCATCLPLPADSTAAKAAADALQDCDALGAGCGLGCSDWAAEVLNVLLEKAASAGIPAVLDADGLNLLAMGKIHLPEGLPLFMTPHPGEAARLLQGMVQHISENPEAAAAALHSCYGASVILKGARSRMAAKEGTAINPFGTPAMAKGGSGDVLTGILSALLAGQKAGLYSLNNLEILQCACALHGLAGEEAAKRFGERGVLAMDLCSYIGQIGTASADIDARRFKY